MTARHRCRLGCLLSATLMASAACAQERICGPLANPYGPYDYRTDRERLPFVDNAHFPPIVENLIRGNRGYLGGDLDYTLRAFPNHHRALIAVMNYGLKLKTSQPHDLPRPVECYFERAIRFRPDDVLVRMIYAEFLMRHSRKNEALAQLASATILAGDFPLTHQNIGLFYVELQEFELARQSAQRAISLGTKPERLIEALTAVRQWTDAQPEAASAPRKD